MTSISLALWSSLLRSWASQMLIKMSRGRTVSWLMNYLEDHEMMKTIWTCNQALSNSTALCSLSLLSSQTFRTPTLTPLYHPPATTLLAYLSPSTTHHHLHLTTFITDITATLPPPLSNLRSSMGVEADTTHCFCLGRRVAMVVGRRVACPGVPMIMSRGSGRGKGSKKKM